MRSARLVFAPPSDPKSIIHLLLDCRRMVLHDSFFLSLHRPVNGTTSSPITVSHSPLFHSTWTLLISLIGCLANLLCLIKLAVIIGQYKKRKKSESTSSSTSSPVHLLSHRKYHFLLVLISNNFCLACLSLLSCLDEKFFFQSLVARCHLCSAHIFLWKLTLHFLPLLTIFVLCRYHYKFYKRFPLKHFNTTASNQLFCTDLCVVIPFVLALAWSVDGLWLWGETNIQDFIVPALASNDTDETLPSSAASQQIERSAIPFEQFYPSHSFHLPEQQQLICYLQINDNLNFTARLLDLVQADYVFLFLLHLLGELNSCPSNEQHDMRKP